MANALEFLPHEKMVEAFAIVAGFAYTLYICTILLVSKKKFFHKSLQLYLKVFSTWELYKISSSICFSTLFILSCRCHWSPSTGRMYGLQSQQSLCTVRVFSGLTELVLLVSYTRWQHLQWSDFIRNALPSYIAW